MVGAVGEPVVPRGESASWVALSVMARTVAAHVEHVLAKLDVPARTLAAVRAEREGLYVPAPATTPSPVR